MGALFGGGGNRNPAPVKPDPVVEDVRPMPDPYSPAAMRAAREEKSRIARRSGRTSTDLTGRRGAPFQRPAGVVQRPGFAVTPNRSVLGSA